MRLGLLAIVLLACGELLAADRPNILWLSCEDIRPHLGCYGDTWARTPNIDRFAEQGVRFTHATVVAPVCAPCRSSIITGMYPTSIGTHHMRCRATLPDFVQPFPMYLRSAGYYCTNNSKTDYQFAEPPGTWDASSGKAHWQNRKTRDQPFFSVFNFTGTHESQIFSALKNRGTTAGIKPCDRDMVAKTLPPYYPDTAVTREDWGRYYDNIAALDRWFGKHLADLAEARLADDTIVFFWSDHGVGLPRAKRWVYDSGMRVPLIVYVPPKWRERIPMSAGSVDDRLVSLMDLGPTVLRVADLEIPSHLQGLPFLGRDLRPRSFVVAARDRMDERYDIIRAVRDKRYKYIVNFQSWKPYYQHVSYAEQSGTMKEIRRLSAVGQLSPQAAPVSARTKPFEELYDLDVDPHEVKNLIADPSLDTTVQSMRKAQREWMRQTLDLGLMPESEIDARGKNLGSRHAILRRPGGAELFDQLLVAAEDVSSGRATLEQLVTLSKDPDAAVRWWGITGIGLLTESTDVMKRLLKESLADPNGCVRIAAARALCLNGEVEVGLPTLIAALADESPWLQLEATLALDELGEASKPALEPLRSMMARGKTDPAWGDHYASRVASWIDERFRQP